MTHAELVNRSVAWLYTSAGCGVVISETATYSTSEIPDAIGWARGGSETYLIECKTSRSDFAADKKKINRDQFGMGTYRYYFTPPKLIGRDELPEGWGLAWVYPSKIVRQRKADRRPPCGIRAFREAALLYKDLESHHDIRRGICPWPNARNAKIIAETRQHIDWVADTFAAEQVKRQELSDRIKQEHAEYKAEKQEQLERLKRWSEERESLTQPHSLGN